MRLADILFGLAVIEALHEEERLCKLANLEFSRFLSCCINPSGEESDLMTEESQNLTRSLTVPQVFGAVQNLCGKQSCGISAHCHKPTQGQIP